MKILIIVPTPFFVSRGTPIRILEEALALERRGHNITLVSYHIGEEIPDCAGAHIDHRRIRRWLFWYKKLEAGANWQKILLDVMLLRKVFSLARKQYPDVLYGHLHEGTLIGWSVKMILFWRKMTLVSDLHGGLTAEMASHGYLRSGIVRSVFQWIERWVNGLGDIIVTSSQENTDSIRATLSPDRKVETLLDGAEITRYGRAVARGRIRAKWHIPEDRFVFVYTGALIPNKGLLPMISAIRTFLNSGERGAYFVLAGFPVEHATELVRSENLEKDVLIISPLSYFDLPELLSVCDAGIDPKDSSVHQASGKILQYMAGQLPVVCLDRENNRLYLGEGGVYCREGAEGLAEGFRYCLEHPGEALEKGKVGRTRVQTMSWDRGAETMDLLLSARLSKKAKGV